MNISNSQVNRLRHFVRAGLRSLFRPEPQTAVEWADANYYLPKESAYQEGRWETLPFQRAIMNAMGSDYIREVNVVKSARVGYSKMLLGVYAYFIEHKQRNTLIWLPTDGDAENFMKTHVEPTIRDIPSLLALAPWYGKKHRDNTLTMKRFTNGRGFWCLGGKAAKNYREKSVDVAGYDELAAFDEDIEQEGSPTFLGDKRIEGSVWPKSIRGSTPKVRGTCQIERAASESPHFMRFHVACPHCGKEQYLKFGDKETPFGLKWMPDDPSSVFYLCEHNACVIRQQELDFTDARYICEKTGIWTRDGILWFSSSGEEIEPPDSVTFHIWTAYSPFTTWVQIVKDWMKTKGDTGKRKTFVNTTLGETWEAKIGERPDAEVMAERKPVRLMLQIQHVQPARQPDRPRRRLSQRLPAQERHQQRPLKPQKVLPLQSPQKARRLPVPVRRKRQKRMRQRQNNQPPLLHPPRPRKRQKLPPQPGMRRLQKRRQNHQKRAQPRAPVVQPPRQQRQELPRRRQKRPRRTQSLLRRQRDRVPPQQQTQKQRLPHLPAPRQQMPGRPQPVPPLPESRQKAPHHPLQQPQRRLAKPLNRPR